MKLPFQMTHRRVATKKSNPPYYTIGKSYLPGSGRKYVS